MKSFTSIQRLILKIQIQTALGSIFRIVYNRYRLLCQGGKELSNATLNALTIIYRLKLRNKTKGLKQYSKYSKLKKEADGIFHRFIAKIRAGGFKYCNCVPVLRRYSVLKLLGANLACHRKCSRNSLEVDSLNVAADEYVTFE